MSLNLLDRLSQQYVDELPFVAYRKPQEERVNLLLQNNSELHHVVDYEESGFVFAPFNSNEKAILLKNDAYFSEPVFPKQTAGTAMPQRGEEDASTKGIHMDLVQKGIDEIATGQLEKVVFSRQVEVQASQKPIELFQNILSQYPTAYCYMWYHPKVGMWLGATPEMLLEVENRMLRTMSLAGTMKSNGEEEPNWGAKELEEQRMVTQFIKDSLQGKVAALTVSETSSSRAGELWHLKTAISGRLNNESNLGEIILSLHPTPAVCGLPKLKSKDFILKHEGYHREFYTGFLGELNLVEEVNRPKRRRNQEHRAYRTIKKRTSLYVNLRCMKMEGKQLTIYVGGGITLDSDPEKEWKETCDKSRTMLNIVGR
ncbi:chorismate-binding protein [Arenibacter lacus]|uniref:chorismate-binding protein n=1 Tax=Arenibacter lacus TaxID=2608629 RepID=UPI00123D18A5|nr:chorismate-binding protein [Arenibacter lacus]